ncbi:MAG: hypothetical protein QOE77_3634 [Blastocatellia bacterium]|jgi:hypothetical protein|nr:hypothetical protein [Blastocatellia bacterium]
MFCEFHLIISAGLGMRSCCFVGLLHKGVRRFISRTIPIRNVWRHWFNYPELILEIDLGCRTPAKWWERK